MTGYMPKAKTTEWATPPDLFARLNERYHFELDPACTVENRTCPRYYTIDDDGLSQPWAPARVYCNPPYGRDVALWVEKAYQESQRGALVVMLLPSRTDVKWFHDYCLPYGEIDYLKGRLKFGNEATPAPFGSMLVTFHPAGSGHMTYRHRVIENDLLRRLVTQYQYVAWVRLHSAGEVVRDAHDRLTALERLAARHGIGFTAREQPDESTLTNDESLLTCVCGARLSVAGSAISISMATGYFRAMHSGKKCRVTEGGPRGKVDQ